MILLQNKVEMHEIEVKFEEYTGYCHRLTYNKLYSHVNEMS